MSDLTTTDKKEMMVIKRRSPLNHPYLKGDLAKKHTGILNQQIFLYKYFETRFQVKQGENTFVIEFHGKAPALDCFKFIPKN